MSSRLCTEAPRLVIGVPAICQTALQLVAACGGSFTALEPPLQAMVQAAAKTVMQSPVAAADMPAVLALIKAVPLLHAADYTNIMSQPIARECCVGN